MILKRLYTQLQRDVQLSELLYDVAAITQDTHDLPLQIKKIRARNYTFDPTLEERAKILSERWQVKHMGLLQTINQEAAALAPILHPLTNLVTKAESLNNLQQLAALLPEIEQTISDIERQITAVENHLRDSYATLEREIAEMMGLIYDLHWSLDQRDRAGFSFQEREIFIIAVEALWTDNDIHLQHSAGVLYLTQQRIIFGGGASNSTAKQTMLWTLPRNLIAEVRLNHHALSGYDELVFILKRAAPSAQIAVLVKGTPDAQLLQEYIQQFIQGTWRTL